MFLAKIFYPFFSSNNKKGAEISVYPTFQLMCLGEFPIVLGYLTLYIPHHVVIKYFQSILNFEKVIFASRFAICSMHLVDSTW